MSKGLGKNYLTPEIVAYHTEDLSRNFVVVDGHKRALPKYYRNKLLDEEQRQQQRNLITEVKRQQELNDRAAFIAKSHLADSFTYEQYIDMQRMARYDKYYRNQKPRQN